MNPQIKEELLEAVMPNTATYSKWMPDLDWTIDKEAHGILQGNELEIHVHSGLFDRLRSLLAIFDHIRSIIP